MKLKMALAQPALTLEGQKLSEDFVEVVVVASSSFCGKTNQRRFCPFLIVLAM